MRPTVVTVAIAAGLLTLGPSSVRAGGFEYTGQGAQSLARGGAVAARGGGAGEVVHVGDRAGDDEGVAAGGVGQRLVSGGGGVEDRQANRAQPDRETA